MNIAVGLLIGVAVGVAQIFLLSKFTTGITGAGGTSPSASAFILAGIAQLLLPFAVLVAVAFLYIEALLWAGIGAGTSLIILGIIKSQRGKKGN